jgi:hypothetical protein
VPDLGSGAARRVGSSPITRTKSSDESWSFFIFNNLVNKMFKVSFYKPSQPQEMQLFLLQ